MRIIVAYGGMPLTLDMPSHINIQTFAPRAIEHPVSHDAFRAEFEQAWDRDLSQITSPLIIVNDAYRHTPTAIVLSWIERLLPGLIQRSQFLIATGSHRPPTDKDLQSIFGGHLKTIRPRVEWHVATDLSSMDKVGTDSLGADVYLNRRVLHHDLILIIGSVEPHYFAGFTGGRKSLFPGLTDLATIERNHNLANSMDAAPMKLRGNPVAEHLDSLLPLVDASRIISIQLVIDPAAMIADVSVGDITGSFVRATEKARALFGHTLERPLDAVICELRSPLDKNMYQSQKALENCQQAVVDGGVAVVVSRCSEGIGSEYFVKEAESWDACNNLPGDGVYRFGSHKISRMVAHQRRIDVRLHSSLPDNVVAKVFYRPAGNLGELISALAINRSDFRLGVVHDSGHTVLELTH